MTKTLYYFIGLFVLLLLPACLYTPPDFNEEVWLDEVQNTDPEQLYAENFAQGTYFNPWMEGQNRSFSSFLRWQFSKTPEYSEQARKNLPTVIPDLIERIGALPVTTNFITWIGHATFLFRIDGEYWLTDPIFSERALLPKRVTPPAMTANDLAQLDGKINVLLSHNHYDHLDKESIKKFPENSSIYVPMGLQQYVASIFPGSVNEMNWWDEQTMASGTTLTCLPAQHWSRRLFQGYNTTLWASYMVSTPHTTLYFGGDSGYFKGYREIGRKFSTIDYALLPTTAYEPRWFMHYAHMDTKEAIHAFDDLQADIFIPTQWGTFHLGDNPPGLPPLDLRRNIKKMALDPERFLILDIGEIHQL